MKHLKFFFIAAIASFFMQSSLAVPCCILDMGIFNDPVSDNKLVVKIQVKQLVVNGNYSGGTFVVRYPTSYGVNLSVSSTDFSYGQTAFGTNSGYTYYAFGFAGGSNLFAIWPMDTMITVAVLKRTNNPAGGIGTFELTTDAFATALTFDYPFYQELAGNGQFGGGNGQQGVFYNTSTNIPLPVELSAFNAAALPDRTVALDWTAVTERDLAYYGVEHSTDGSKFSELDQVEGRGTPLVPAVYGYIHVDPASGANYYRLRMVDRNGAFEYSPIRTVALADRRNDFSLLPTPTTGPLALMSKHLDQYADGLRYQLSDNLGKLLQTDIILNEKTDFNLSAYAAGIYYLSIFTDQEQVKQFKVVVTRD